MSSLSKWTFALMTILLSAPAWAPPPNVVPEPGTLGLLAFGMVGLGITKRRSLR
jgi:hypothetical protein